MEQTPAAPRALAPLADAGDVPADPTTTLGDPRTYDPADYRWVPVRRVPRYDGWTEEKQRRFIEVLADTGQVRLACAAVKLSRESAYKLRRAPGGEAFARAWDVARLHAATALEDVAFERAFEGTPDTVFNRDGEPVERRRYSDRLLIFMLRHLKPETYGHAALASPPPAPPALDAVLRAIEPALPAPPETLLPPDTLDHELMLADIGQGQLPHWMGETRVDAGVEMDPDQRILFEGALEAAKLHSKMSRDMKKSKRRR